MYSFSIIFTWKVNLLAKVHLMPAGIEISGNVQTTLVIVSPPPPPFNNS